MQVHLWGELGWYAPGRRSRFEFTLEHEMPVAEVLLAMGVPIADVAVMGLNGEIVRADDPSLMLADRDRIDLFPPTSGG